MRNKASTSWIVLFAVLLATGCGASLSSIASSTRGQRIAVVSLSINDFGGTLQGWNSARTSDLMYSRAATMVSMAEQQLATHWTVVPAPTFVANPAYQQMGTMHEVAVPYFNGVPMPVMAPDRGSLIRARLMPQQAQALAQIAQADLLCVIYSEWGVATGGFIPTSKALAKTVVSIYDSSGNLLWSGRDDQRGERTIGAMGAVVVDNNTVDEWVNAYGSSFANIIMNR
jgi:hypothetical protein